MPFGNHVAILIRSDLSAVFASPPNIIQPVLTDEALSTPATPVVVIVMNGTPHLLRLHAIRMAG